MNWQWILAAWTGIGLLWWVMASVLVASARQHRDTPGPVDPRRITIFKALAGPLDEQEFSRLGHSLATFVAELDANSELLIGAHHADQARWRAFVRRMRERHPAAEIKLVVHQEPGRYAANPKVSWMQILAPHATGELWFWSDADIQAPAGALRSLRADFAREKACMVTSPYVILRGGNAPGLLDTLFVNLEFYPGVMLLGRLDRIQFGFGSGMLFEAGEFRRRADWGFLGACLADDFHLGRLLQPVRLASMRLTTVPASESWLGAIAHYHRWQKTIRWSTPGSFAAQLTVLPALGWLAWLAFNPTLPFGWLGLATVLAMDTVAALWICARLGCRVGWRRLHAIPLWTLIRALTWAACWVPSPIVWRGRRWWSPRQATTGEVSTLETRQQPGAE
jgi:hypothetical protein